MNSEWQVGKVHDEFIQQSLSPLADIVLLDRGRPSLEEGLNRSVRRSLGAHMTNLRFAQRALTQAQEPAVFAQVGKLQDDIRCPETCRPEAQFAEI